MPHPVMKTVVLALILVGIGSLPASSRQWRSTSNHKLRVITLDKARRYAFHGSRAVLVVKDLVFENCWRLKNDWVYAITVRDPRTNTRIWTEDSAPDAFLLGTTADLGESLISERNLWRDNKATIYFSPRDVGLTTNLNCGMVQRVDFTDAKGHVVKTISIMNGTGSSERHPTSACNGARAAEID